MATQDTLVSNHILFSPSEIQELVEVRFRDQKLRDRAMLILGPPGSAKTEGMYQAASRLGAVVQPFDISVMTKEDMGGIPIPRVPSKDDLSDATASEHVKYLFNETLIGLSTEEYDMQRNRWEEKRKDLVARGQGTEAEAMGEYPEPQKTILFFDEALNAPSDIQALMHTLIQHKTFANGTRHLHPNVMIAMASNSRSDGAFVNRAGAPFLDRIDIYRTRMSVEDWLIHARNTDCHPAILAYVSSRKDSDVLNVTGKREEELGAPINSSRGWVAAANIFDNKELQPAPGDSAERRSLKNKMRLGSIEGALKDPGTGRDFMEFIKRAIDAPTPEEIVAKHEKGELSQLKTFKENPDVALFVVENMLRALNRKPEWVTAFIEYAEFLQADCRQLLHMHVTNVFGDVATTGDTKQAILRNVFTNKDNLAKVASTIHTMGDVDKDTKEGSRVKRVRKDK